MGDSFETVPVGADVETALTEVQHVANAPAGDTGSGLKQHAGLMKHCAQSLWLTTTGGWWAS